jgi:hypothetical protein
MYKSWIVFLFVLVFCCVSYSSTGLPNEISNILLQNVMQTSVDVVWTTVHPSTSQVLLARDTNYEPERRIPAIADPALVTAHRVTVDHLLPYTTASGQYYIKCGWQIHNWVLHSIHCFSVTSTNCLE